MSRHRPWLLSVYLLFLGASVGSAPLAAQPAATIELLDSRGATTSVVPENGSWRVRVVDEARDYYPTPDILGVEATSAATGDQEYFSLQETGPSTGVFEGVIESAAGPSGFGNKILETATGPAPGFTLDTVQVRHLLPDSTYLTATATVAPSITTLIDDFGNPAGAYTVGHPVRVRVEDHNLDSPLVVGTTTVQLTTLCNDLETLVLTETGAATQVYEGSLPSNTGPTFGVPGDGAVQLIYLIPDFVTAVHADGAGGNGGTQSSDVAGSNNGSIVFLDEHGGPPASLLEGSRARLRVYEYLGGYPPNQGSLTATLSSAIGADQQTVQLWETGPATGVYEGWIAIEPAYDPGSDQLFISRIVNGPGSPPTYDTLTASYMPYDGPLVTATAQVTGFAEIAVIDEDGRKVEAVPVGDRLRVRVRNPAEKEADWVLATVRSPASFEREPMALFRTAAGSDVFEGSLPMVEGYPTAFNGTLEVYLGETIEVEHVDAGATDSVKATFVPTGLRIQFLDEDGAPTDRLLLGFPVRVRVFNQSPNLPVGDLWVQSDYPGWDAEMIALTPTSQAGTSEGSVPMGQGTAVYNDGRLDVTEVSDPLPGRYNTVSASISCPGSLCPKAEAEIVPALVAFVNEQGHPMDAYAVGSRVDVRLTRKGWPTDVEQAQVVVRSLSTGSEQTVTLTETGIDTNRFVGSVLTADEDGPATSGRVRVRAGETISVVYTNADGTVSVDDTARIAAGTAELLDADGNPAESYLIGTAVHVRAVQLSANTNPTAANVIPIVVWTARSNHATWDREYMTLTETGPDTGVFTGTMDLPQGYPQNSDGQLQAYYGLYDWEVDFNPMTVVVSLPNDLATVADRAGTHPAEMSFVDAQGNPTETLTLGGPVRLRVTDFSGSPDWEGTIQVRLASASTGDTVDLVLTESGPATGLYEAVVPSASGTAVSGDTTLQAASGETVRAFHLSSYGDGLVAVASAVMNVNAPPIANPDLVTFEEDSLPSITLDVLANDSDPEGQPLQVTEISYPSGYGTFTLNPDGSITYEPTPNQYYTIQVSYTLTDGLSSVIGEAVFEVIPVPDPPTANPDTVTIPEGGQIQISVLDNDQVGDVLGLSVGAVTNGAHGTAVNLGNTWVVYTQTDNDFHGTDTFTYVLEGGDGQTATGTVTVIIEPVDDFIFVQDDTATTDEDTPVTIAVLANDVDVDSPKSVTAVTQGAHGTVVLNPDSTVTYTPNANYSGTDTFTYIGAGTPPNDDEGLVTVTIVAANDAPAANDASFSVDENSANGTAVGTVTATDPDLPAQALTYALTGGNTGGAFAINASTGEISVASSGALDFDTTPAFTLTVTVSDSATPSLSDTATVTINLSDINEAPTAQDATFSVAENASNGAAIGTATASDPDLPAQTLTFAITGGNASGAFAIDASTGAITVANSAALDFETTPSFTLTVTVNDSGTPSLSDTAAVTVNVSNLNEVPVAVADSGSTSEDSAVTVSVLANDTDPENNALAVTAVTQGANGSVTFNATSVTYTPAANFSGSDSFSYTISDGNGGTATASVAITITGVNDSPVAVADTGSTAEDSAVTVSVLTNDTDPENNTLAVTAVTQGANGTVTFTGTAVTYTPAANFSGADSFSYTISDGNGGTATASVSITITGVNDSPVAVADSASTNEDSAVTVSVLTNDTDPENNPLEVTAVTQGANGTVTFTGAAVTYTPAANFNGSDSFTYTISDGNGGTATASVSITISAVNDSPVAVADSASTSEDSAVTVSVLTNDTDPENNTLAVTAVTQGANGTVTFTGTAVTYTPAANFNGSDSFTYTVSDGNGGTATASVSITITGVNDSPVAVADSASTSEDNAVSVSVLTNDTDPENNALAVTAVTQGTKGAVTFSAGSVTYTPAANTSGADAFSYTVSDGNGGTATATVTVSVAAVNDAPTAGADAAVTRENTAIGVNLLANDADVEGNTLSILAVSTPAFGTAASFAGNPSIAYTPNSNFNGVDTFTYTVSDGQGGTATATVTITVKDALERVAVLGTNSVYVQTGADVLSGDVIANQSGTGPFLNGSVELSFAGTVTTAAGYDVQANRMLLAAGSTVGGDAFYNTRTGTGSVTGSTTSPLTLPIFSTLPAFLTATPGSTNISVGTNGTRILTTGSYGDLVVGRKGVVSLSGGGIFHFRSIRLDREARLIFSDPSQVRVQQRLTTANLVDIGPTLNATFDASSIIFYVGGINGTGGGLAETPKAVEIGVDTILDANLYAPNGTIWLRDRTQARGSFLGKDVQVGVDVQVTLDSFFVGQ